MPRNIRKRGTTWWYRIRHEGQDYEGSLETENLAVAKERLERRRQELIATGWGEKPRRSFNDAAERFGTEHFANLKASSARRYVVSIANLLDTFSNRKLDEIGSALLGDFVRSRRAAGVSGSTIRRDLACLSSIFTLAEEWEWVARNPVRPFLRASTMKGLEEGAARTRWLTHDEEADILSHAPPKAAAAFAFLIDTGLRKEELLSLLRSDIDRRTREIVIRPEVAKSGKSRRVPLWDRAWRFVTERPADLRSLHLFTTEAGRRYSESSPYLYECLQKAVARANKARAATGSDPMAHVELHDLRRTCGCRLLQDHGRSMEFVSRWLGHSSIKVTERHYAFLSESHLREFVERREAEIVRLRPKE